MDVFVKKKNLYYFYTFRKIRTCRCEIRGVSSSRVVCHVCRLEASVGKMVMGEEDYGVMVGSLGCHSCFPHHFTHLSAAPKHQRTCSKLAELS